VVGVVSEEPELLAGHMAGRSTEVDWSLDDDGEVSDGEASEEPGAPHVGAGPSFGRRTGEALASSEPDARRTSGTGADVGRSAASAGNALPEPSFAIQVGAFGDAGSAKSIATHLRDSGYPVHVVEPERDDRWRVRVGPVQGRDEADRIAARLKSEEQLPTWVLREQGS
jgi:cell division septation protein DedD